MIKGGGKRKGSAFERTVAKTCDKWWKAKPNTFWRTPLSGGWHVPGDISPAHHVNSIWWPFVIECKFYKKISLWELLQSKNPLLLKWWSQLCREQLEAQEYKTHSIDKPVRLLVFKFNQSPIYAMYSKDDLPIDIKGINIDINPQNLTIVLFSTFINSITEEDIKIKLLGNI